jgi:hypothetical protein
MRYLLVSLVTLGLLLGGAQVLPDAEASTAFTGTMKFGMDARSVKAQTDAGVKPDYGTMWIGPWNLVHGWNEPRSQMTQMRNAGVTPVIHFYYWGDDISQRCFERGCWSSLHNVNKNQADWQRLAQQLVNNLNSRMGGERVIIVMESEFNKGDMQNYKPFDKALADKANFIKKNYPNARIVLGLGNWNHPAWSTWSQAAAASHMIGIQAMRGSTQDSLTSYRNLYESTLAGAQHAQKTFGKRVLITDIALSSYQEPTYLRHQAEALQKFFDGRNALKQAGVTGMIYRAWHDDPNKNLQNYYGKAERSWGIAWASGNWKPAASVWVDSDAMTPSRARCRLAAPRIAVRLVGNAPNTHAVGGKVRLLGGAIPVQEREVHAHLTLARAGKAPVRSGDVAAVEVPPEHWEARVVAVWRSRLGGGKPARYEEVASAVLGAP